MEKHFQFLDPDLISLQVVVDRDGPGKLDRFAPSGHQFDVQVPAEGHIGAVGEIIAVEHRFAVGAEDAAAQILWRFGEYFEFGGDGVLLRAITGT